MKNTSVKLSALMGSLLVSAGVMAADATVTPVLKQPLVLDNYTPDARTSENKETYKNTVTPSVVAGPGHNVVGQSNIVNATDGSSTVIGGQNFVADTAKDGNIFGDGSSITGYQSQAGGDNNHLIGEQNSAFGMNNQINGNHTHAFGGNNEVTGDKHVAIGQSNIVTGEESVAIGYETQATGGESTIAIGNNAHATADQTTSIGVHTQATGAFSQAIGSYTVASGEKSVAIGDHSTAAGGNSISIGGSKAAAENNIAIGGSAVTDKMGSVAIGNNALALGDYSTALGIQSKALGGVSTAIGDGAKASESWATALGGVAAATATNAVALGGKSAASHVNSIALGFKSETKEATSVTEATVGKLTYDGFAGNNPQSVVSVGTEGSERQIVNVAAGQINATSTDAINGSQLYATQDVINNVAGSATNVLGGNAQVDNKGNITMTDIGGTGENTVHDAIKSHTDKIAANAKGVADNAKAIADNSAKIADNTNAIAENTKAINTNTADIRAAEKSIDKNAKDIAQNTKDIAANTDYIKAVEQKLPVVAAGKNTTVDVVTDANGKVTYTVNSTDFQPAIDKNAKGIADNTKAISTNTAKIADVEQEAKRHTIVEAGHNMEVTSSKDENGATVYKVATSKDIGVNSLTVYNGPKITKDGIDARNTKIKNVTAGEDDNDAVNVSQLNQVKARQDAQSHALKQVRHTVINHGARIANVENRVTGLENKVDRLDRDVKKNRKRADAGISAVAAMANIPQVYLPGKSGVGVGAGYKHGQSAIAVGYSRSSDNGHHIIKLSAGVDTQKDVTLGAGYMYQW